MPKTHSFNRITHFIPPENFKKIETEFVEPSCEPYFIHFLFMHRCLECKQIAYDIHEIIPRSRSKKSILDYKNRVVLCRSCHEKFHHNGVTIQKIKDMQELRKNYLISISREKYV